MKLIHTIVLPLLVIIIVGLFAIKGNLFSVTPERDNYTLETPRDGRYFVLSVQRIVYKIVTILQAPSYNTILFKKSILVTPTMLLYNFNTGLTHLFRLQSIRTLCVPSTISLQYLHTLHLDSEPPLTV